MSEIYFSYTTYSPPHPPFMMNSRKQHYPFFYKFYMHFLFFWIILNNKKDRFFFLHCFFFQYVYLLIGSNRMHSSPKTNLTPSHVRTAEGSRFSGSWSSTGVWCTPVPSQPLTIGMTCPRFDEDACLKTELWPVSLPRRSRACTIQSGSSKTLRGFSLTLMVASGVMEGISEDVFNGLDHPSLSVPLFWNSSCLEIKNEVQQACFFLLSNECVKDALKRLFIEKDIYKKRGGCDLALYTCDQVNITWYIRTIRRRNFLAIISRQEFFFTDRFRF